LTQIVPVRVTVPSVSFVGAVFESWPMVNSTRPSTTRGTTYASLPFFLPSHQDRTSGIRMPQAGLGQVTVRVQIQAMTPASVPSGNFALG
jgi:hypothetical protein